MKLGVVGKGGVGKTTVAALLARAFSAQGRRVLAVDTDSNPNLGISLGLTLGEVDAARALPRSAILGDGDGLSVGELVDGYGLATPADVTLLTAMRVEQAGGGCTCGSHARVRNVLGQTIEERADIAVIDMEAGLEHLSRSGGTLAYADLLLVVLEPSLKSVLTAARTRALAEDLGIERVYAVGNKAGWGDAEFFETACAERGIPLAAVLPDTPEIGVADRSGTSAVSTAPEPLRAGIDRLVEFVTTVPVG